MALPTNYFNQHPPTESASRPTLVIFLPNLIGGGAERCHINMASSFIAAGFDVTFLLYRDEGVVRELLPPSVRVVALGGAHSLINLIPLVQFLRREHPRYLISSLGHNNIIAIWAAALARVSTKIIVSEHNVLALDCADRSPWDWRYKILPSLYRLFIGRADEIIAVSAGVANSLSANVGVPRSRITVIYNPVVTDDFDQKMNEAVTHPWLQSREIPVFLGVGSFIPVKDFSTLIGAFYQVIKQKDARLILLGDGPMRKHLMSLTEKIGIADRVSMPGYQLNPLPYIHAATALVLSSRHEGFGNVLVEALACGTNIICTDCPYGPGEILERGRFGRMVPIGNAKEMAKAMLQALKQDLVPPSVLRARSNDFTVQRIANQYVQVLKK